MSKSARRRGRPRKAVVRDADDRPVRASQREQREATLLPMIEARSKALGMWPAPLVRDPGEPDEVWAARQAARMTLIKATYAYLGMPHLGFATGRAIRGEPDWPELWDTIKMITGRYAAYQRALDAPRPSTDVFAGALLDSGEDGVLVTDASTDIRSDDERAHDAIRAWKRLTACTDEGWLLEVVEDRPTRGFVGWLRQLGVTVRGG